MQSVIRRMITVSDNSAADLTYRLVGRSAVQRLARVAHMRSFTAGGASIVSRVGSGGHGALLPRHGAVHPEPAPALRQWPALARRLVPVMGHPRWLEGTRYRVYFKPGWLGAWILANEAARLERKRVTIGLAVFTDSNPSSSDGKETIAGVTARF